MRRFICLSLLCLGMLGCVKDTQPNAAKSPEMLWKVPLSNGGETTSMNPVVYKNIVIYTADDGSNTKSKVIALDKSTGQKIWEWKNNKESLGYISLTNTYLGIWKKIIYPII